MNDFEIWLEDNPFDPTACAEHFQTEEEYIVDLQKYNDLRLEMVWNHQQTKLEELQSENAKLKECLIEAEDDLYEICLHNPSIKSNSLVKLTKVLKELNNG